jgi:hypothetical protein
MSEADHYIRIVDLTTENHHADRRLVSLLDTWAGVRLGQMVAKPDDFYLLVSQANRC